MATNALYLPLDRTKLEFRFLYVIPGSDDGMVHCDMFTAPLGSIPFCALSYVWGDPHDIRTIMVNGHEMAATANLESALHRIRREFPIIGFERPFTPKVIPAAEPCPIWVDAICINQSDLGERADQVTMMEALYSEAFMVIAWFGSGQSYSLGLSAINVMAESIRRCQAPSSEQPGDLKWLVHALPILSRDLQQRELVAIINSIEKFLQDAYWERVWIYQEFVLAQDLAAVNVDEGVPLENLELVTETLRGVRQTESSHIVQPESLSEDIWDIFLLHLFADAWDNLDARFGLRRTGGINQPKDSDDVNDSEQHQFLTRCRLNTSFYPLIVGLRASDPRDTLYGLLGLSCLDIAPSYSTPLADVWIDYTRRWMSSCLYVSQLMMPPPYQSAALSFLKMTGAGLPGQRDDLPSWALDLSRSCSFPMGYIGAGSPILPIQSSPLLPSIQAQSLHIRGYLIGRITEFENITGEENLLDLFLLSIRKTATWLTISPLELLYRCVWLDSSHYRAFPSPPSGKYATFLGYLFGFCREFSRLKVFLLLPEGLETIIESKSLYEWINGISRVQSLHDPQFQSRLRLRLRQRRRPRFKCGPWIRPRYTQGQHRLVIKYQRPKYASFSSSHGVQRAKQRAD